MFYDYLIIYILVILSCFIIQKGNKYSTVLFILLGVSLVLFAAFRDGTKLNDYDNYVDLYDNSSTLIGTEPSFILISLIVKSFLYNQVLFLFIIYAFIGVSIKLLSIKRLTEFYFFSLLIYLSNFYILQELTQIRAGVSAAIILCSIKPLYDRNWKLFFSLSAIAFLFHYSAIICFLLWFISGSSFNKKVYLSIIPISYFLFFFHIDFIGVLKLIPIQAIQSKVELYLSAVDSNFITKKDINIFNSLQILRIILFYFLMYKIDYIIIKNKYMYILMKIYSFAIISLVLLSSFPVIAFRVSDLLLIVEIVLIPNLIYIFRPSLLGKIIVLCFCFVQVFLSLFYLKLISF